MTFYMQIWETLNWILVDQMMVNVRFVCMLLLSSLSQYETNGFKSAQLNEDLLSRLLTGLQKAYDFYYTVYHDINLDGIYGLRVSEGNTCNLI